MENGFDYEKADSPPLREQALQLSVQITEIVRSLRQKNAVFPLCDRLLNCGIQVGLALRDFEKDSPEIRYENAVKAAGLAREAEFIIEMAQTAGYLEDAQCGCIRADCRELEKSASSVNKQHDYPDSS